MDKNTPNVKWFVSVVMIVGTAIGASYFIYLNWKSKKSANAKKLTDNKISKSSPPCQDHDENIDSIKRQGNVFFNEGQYEQAISCYDIAIDRCPLQCVKEKAILYQNKSASLHSLNRLDEALVDANRALDLSPRYKNAYIRRSKIHEAQGRYHEALSDMIAAVVFNSSEEKEESIDRIDHLVDHVGIFGVEQELTKDTFLQSNSEIRNYLDSFPNDPLHHPPSILMDMVDQQETNQCFQLLNLEKYQESFQAVKQALDNFRGAENLKTCLSLLRGTFYWLSCKEELAFSDFEFVSTSQHSTPLMKVNAIIKMATIKFSIDDNLDIETLFEDALKFNLDIPDIFYHRGLLYEMKERWNCAVQDFQRALELNPNYSFAAVHGAFNNYKIGSVGKEKYSEEFLNLAKEFPNSIDVHLTHVKILLDEGRTTEAEKTLDDILSLYPESGLILFVMGETKFSQNKILEAKDVLLNAIEKDPRNPDSYHLLASINVRTQNFEKAIEYWDIAIKYSRNKKNMKEYIEYREGVKAQLNVAKTCDIPIQNVFAKLCQGYIFPFNIL